MAVIIPKQPKKERDQIAIRLDRDVIRNPEHYCRYLESGRDYVINQCLAFIFRKDKPFAMWRASQGIGVSPATNGAAALPASPKAAKRKSQPSAMQGRLSIGQEASK
jgi:hypothetical protein